MGKEQLITRLNLLVKVGLDRMDNLFPFIPLIFCPSIIAIRPISLKCSGRAK